MRALILTLVLIGCRTREEPHTGAATTNPASPSAPSPATESATAAVRSPPPPSLVDLADFIPDVIVDMRYRDDANFTGSPLPGYGANRCWLRREVAEAAARAATVLASREWRLKVWDCWRPLSATKAMVAWAKRVGREDLLGVYIGERSMHNAGVAVDLTLADANGLQVDMGTPFDEFSERAHTANATGNILERRLVVKRAMEAAGFTAYSKEWWHFYIALPNRRPLNGTIRP